MNINNEVIAGLAGGMYGVPGLMVMMNGAFVIGLIYLGLGIILRYSVLKTMKGRDRRG